MVEMFPRNKSYQSIYRVIPGRRGPFGVADPGSSLLEQPPSPETTSPQTTSVSSRADGAPPGWLTRDPVF
ncbi:MAG: hypothetical protein BWX75_01085 [Candidatus Cloacimonetes bacterium ADurb.Bin088]|nr:MAG: hypothetical protein BWX75_01085 [Candidatus Cloacimonetes bacterium ADurb.Bin088]